jgi:hypothetical protein
MNSAKDIARQLSRSPFNFRRFILVPNVSWGLLPWEADLLALSSSDYLYEIEIKISIADLKRDQKKRKWGRFFDSHNMIRAMWYAMPRKVWEHKDAAEALPAEAGVIVVEQEEYTHRSYGDWSSGKSTFSEIKKTRTVSRVIREAKRNNTARKLTRGEAYQLARLGAMRQWTNHAYPVITHDHYS